MNYKSRSWISRYSMNKKMMKTILNFIIFTKSVKKTKGKIDLSYCVFFEFKIVNRSLFS